ncbi:transposase family protein [Amycolatopsis sp. NPDC051106]|uniref:transposase family protein n=1 Tax=unclassified Amycolatopsis TaxID=2618356 RepID=UPI003441991A
MLLVVDEPAANADLHGGGPLRARITAMTTPCRWSSKPDGFPLWCSEVEPGSAHDITAAREHVLSALYWAYSHLDLPTSADGGYAGTGIGVHTPVKQPAGNQALDADNRTYKALLRGLRCLGERAFALLVGRWRALRHITTSPRKIGTIVNAALVLIHIEHGRLN